MYLGNREATTDEDNADLFDTLFQSVFTKSDYQKKIDETKLIRTDNEIDTALQALNIGKAKGQDRLGNLPLKRLANSMSKSIELVFNTIGNKHIFPTVWKTGSIITLFKYGDKQSIANS